MSSRTIQYLQEERVMCMTEALCHAIRKYDHYEWCNRFHEDHLRPEDVASTFVFNVSCSLRNKRLNLYSAFHCEIGLVIFNRNYGLTDDYFVPSSAHCRPTASFVQGPIFRVRDGRSQ